MRQIVRHEIFSAPCSLAGLGADSEINSNGLACAKESSYAIPLFILGATTSNAQRSDDVDVSMYTNVIMWRTYRADFASCMPCVASLLRAPTARCYGRSDDQVYHRDYINNMTHREAAKWLYVRMCVCVCPMCLDTC